MSNVLERTKNEKEVFGSYPKKAVAEQNTKKKRNSHPVITQGSAEKGPEAAEKGLGDCFLWHKGSKCPSTFNKHSHVMSN